MRHGIWLLLLVMIAGCSSNEKELQTLRRENAKLKAKLSEYEQAIVLTPATIDRYVSPVTFGPVEVEPNEKMSVTTVLALDKLPEDFQVKWRCKPEPMATDQWGDITRFFDNVYSEPGIRRMSGSYTVVFPNGKKWFVPWERECEVK